MFFNWSKPHRSSPLPLDKRLIYIAVGDRAQIGHMELEEFAKLDKEQVLSIMDSHKYGQRLLRPSIEDACLDERSKSESPPVVTITSSEDDSSPPPPPPYDEGPSSSSGGGRSSMWGSLKSSIKQSQGAKNRILKFSRSSKEPSKKKLFQGPLEVNEERELREMLIPILLPTLCKVEEFQTSHSIALAQAQFEEIPVEDLQKTASSLASELDMAALSDDLLDMSRMTDELDFLEVTNDDIGYGNETYEGGSTSGCDTPSDKDTTKSAISGEDTFLSQGAYLGPLPEMDTFDLFLAKKVNESQIVNISTDESVLEVSRGKSSDRDAMEL